MTDENLTAMLAELDDTRSHIQTLKAKRVPLQLALMADRRNKALDSQLQNLDTLLTRAQRDIEGIESQLSLAQTKDSEIDQARKAERIAEQQVVLEQSLEPVQKAAAALDQAFQKLLGLADEVTAAATTRHEAAAALVNLRYGHLPIHQRVEHIVAVASASASGTDAGARAFVDHVTELAARLNLTHSLRPYLQISGYTKYASDFTTFGDAAAIDTKFLKSKLPAERAAKAGVGVEEETDAAAELRATVDGAFGEVA